MTVTNEERAIVDMTVEGESSTAKMWRAEVLKRGGITRLSTPEPATGSPDVDDAVTRYRRTLAAHTAARADLSRAEEALKTAEATDRSAHADSILAGSSKDPGVPATDKASALLVAGQRHRDAAALAVERAASQLRAALRVHGGDVASKAEADAHTAHVDALAASTALADASQRLTTARRLHGWARRGDGHYNARTLTPIDQAIADAVDATRTALTEPPVPAAQT